MKTILLIVFAIFNLNAQDFNKLDEKGKKHGLWKGYHEESKRLRYEGVFEHGKEVGMFKFFDDTKVNSVIATREFNPKDNSCYTIFYNQKGSKVSEGKLVNRLYEGEWKYYHLDSPAIMTTELYSKGQLNGARKVYYIGGAIAEETNYKNGKKEGAYKKYAENGIALEEANYKNGEYNGAAVFKDVNGAITAKGNFTNGKKTGIWEFLENGKMVKKNMNLQGKKFQPKKARPEPE